MAFNNPLGVTNNRSIAPRDKSVFD